MARTRTRRAPAQQEPQASIFATPAAAAPAAPESATDAYALLAQQAAELQAQGKTIPHHLAKALREHMLLEQAECFWDRPGDVAAEVGRYFNGGSVTVQTLRNRKADGFPLKTKLTPKHLVYRWLLDDHVRRHQAAANPEAASVDDQLDRDLKRIRIAKQSHTLIHEAEDRARQAVMVAASQLLRRLTHQATGEAFDACRGKDRAEFEVALRAVIERHLQQWREEHQPMTTQESD